MRRWEFGLWGGLFAAGLGAVFAGFALGHPREATVAAVTVAVGVTLLVLERLFPERAEWLVPDNEGWRDAGHLFFGFGVGTFSGAWLAQALFAVPIWSIWPSTWPVLVQVALGLVAAEFFGYWQHRAVHSIPALWPLHALHHTTSRMTFFKTTRIHALDIGSAVFLSTSPLLAFGAPVDVILWVTAFGNFSAQMQHANVRLPTPAWVNAIITTPSVHWLHHSIDKREGNSNFGMNVMVFDHLFGTYVPPRRERDEVLGIDDNPVPATFLGQLALPFTMVWRFIRRS